MDESTTDMTRGPHSGRPYWMVALILLGVVALVLAAAFLLNQRLRLPIGIEPAATTRPSTPSTRPVTNPTAAPTGSPVTSTPTTTATTTPMLSPRQQVVQAYRGYWHIYSRALYTLRTSGVNAVAADGELQRIQAEVAGFRQEDRAVHVRVTHHYLIVSVRGDRAQLYDEQLDRSFLIDPVTKDPHTASNKGHRETDIYFLKKIDGVWKVTKSLRQQG